MGAQLWGAGVMHASGKRLFCVLLLIPFQHVFGDAANARIAWSHCVSTASYGSDVFRALILGIGLMLCVGY